MSFEPERQNTCFGCGPANSGGLQLRFVIDPAGSASADWVPASQWEGFRGIVHGGIISTVLDEVMAKAVSTARKQAATGELRVRFSRPVKTGDAFQIRGWLVNRTERLLEAEASLTDASGNEYAHGWGTFVVLKNR